jgi:hypothetical protein
LQAQAQANISGGLEELGTRVTGEHETRRREPEPAPDGSVPGPAEPEFTTDELQQLEERLRNLGYLG